MTELAIFGGKPSVRAEGHVRWPVLGPEEREAVLRVLDRGVLSGPFAPEVRALESHAGDVLVLVKGAGADRARIGITVSSKIANAVGRNRVKRWVREAFRAVRAELPAVDLVVIARRGAPEMGLAGARRALDAARERLREARA